MIRRGDVVLVRFPFVAGPGVKYRPSIVVQNDGGNQRLHTTIVAAISSNVQLAGQSATQLLIDPTSSDGRSSGLLHASVVKCETLYSVAKSEIRRVIGSLPPALMQHLDQCLKASLGIV